VKTLRTILFLVLARPDLWRYSAYRVIKKIPSGRRGGLAHARSGRSPPVHRSRTQVQVLDIDQERIVGTFVTRPGCMGSPWLPVRPGFTSNGKETPSHVDLKSLKVLTG